MPSFRTLPLFALSASVAFAKLPNQLQAVLDNTHGSTAYEYPTDITRGIIPKGLHSHNDYWRDVPFWSALSIGAISTEADVWLVNDTLYVGHERAALTEERTLTELYLDPIQFVLNRTNPESPFVNEVTRNGVFDANSGQTLYLFIDLKTGVNDTYPAVVEALEPLYNAGWLTFYNETSDSRVDRPITVIGTGNTDRATVEQASPRYVFFDGPIATLKETDITAKVSPIVSGSFNSAVSGAPPSGLLDSAQVDRLKEQIQEAHNRGIKTRYWETPLQPVRTRNRVWTTLWEAGVDLINVDDLDGAVELWEA